jgi:hypothetical protein
VDCKSSFDDVMREVRSSSTDGRFNALYEGTHDRVAEGVSDYLDELGTLFAGRHAAQRVIDEADAPQGMFLRPEDSRLGEIVELRYRMLHRTTTPDPGPEWRLGINLAASCLMGAAMRDLPPVSADYQSKS